MKRLMILTVGLCLLFSFALPRQAVAGQCHKINTELTSVALDAFNTVGSIRSGLLKGTTKFTGDPASFQPIVSIEAPPDNPSFSYTGDLEIKTKHGSLTTRSVGVLEFIPLGLGTQLDRVITGSGTGRFEGATGFLFFNFQASPNQDGFVATVTGVICTP